MRNFPTINRADRSARPRKKEEVARDVYACDDYLSKIQKGRGISFRIVTTNRYANPGRLESGAAEIPVYNHGNKTVCHLQRVVCPGRTVALRRTACNLSHKSVIKLADDNFPTESRFTSHYPARLRINTKLAYSVSSPAEFVCAEKMICRLISGRVYTAVVINTGPLIGTNRPWTSHQLDESATTGCLRL